MQRMFRTHSRKKLQSLLLATQLTALLATSGCNNTTKILSATDVATIHDLDTAWSNAASAHDINKTVSYYADDAYLLAPGEPLANNKAAIRASWTGLLSVATTISWQPIKIEAYGDGLAYAVGTYSATMKDGKGGQVPDHGKFLEVWRKLGSNEWKCVADSYSSDLPTPQ
jgi:ketosteroid isomerase-like protein